MILYYDAETHRRTPDRPFPSCTVVKGPQVRLCTVMITNSIKLHVKYMHHPPPAADSGGTEVQVHNIMQTPESFTVAIGKRQ